MCNSCIMGDAPLPTRWLLASVELADAPGQAEAGRELRELGAIQVGDDVWAVPDTPEFAAPLSRLGTVVHADPSERMRLMTAFNAARTAEWAEFRADVRDFDEAEPGLDRLRERAHEIQARDIFSVPEAEVADRDLRARVALLPHLDSNQKPFD